MKRPTMGDAWGALAAVAVSLPQALAFGVALLTPFGFDAASGALAGLVAATALNLVTGVAGGTSGMISAPTGPTLVLQAAALGNLVAAGLTGGDLLTGFALVLVCTGLILSAIGLSGGGRLVKLLPYPVVAGFVTGTGVVMILSQVDALGAEAGDPAWQGWHWLPVATAAVTMAAIYLAPRVLPRIPGTIAGLVVGIVFFQAVAWLGPGPVPEAWVIGQLPELAAMQTGLRSLDLAGLPWAAILTSALALAVLASIDTLLTSVLADVQTRARHDARRELVGQGLGYALSGVVGGMGGAGSAGATLLATRSGGRRWVATGGALLFGTLVLAGGPVGYVLPISVLAGVIIQIAIGMFERDVLGWLRSPGTRLDGAIALTVTAVTVVYDLMVAVGVGVAIAVVVFLRSEARTSPIHRRSNGAELHSVKARTDRERAALDAHPEGIVVYELRGNLFFATTDHLFEEIVADLSRPARVVFDLRRVVRVDITAVKILVQIADRLVSSGGSLAFCEVNQASGLGHDVEASLRKVDPSLTQGTVPTFESADVALAWAEDGLLRELGAARQERGGPLPLDQVDLFAGLGESAAAELEQAMDRRRVPAGEVLFREGDPGDELMVVVQGRVDIVLRTGAHHSERLASYGPGTLFGEIAFLDPGPRSADAVAVEPTELLAMGQDALRRVSSERPELALALLRAIGTAEGHRLRRSDAIIRRLSEW